MQPGAEAAGEGRGGKMNLTDEKLAELSDPRKSGPTVVAMAVEIIRLRAILREQLLDYQEREDGR